MLSSVGPYSNRAMKDAYNYMTLAWPLEMRHEGYQVENPKVSFKEFKSEIQSGKIVNPNYAANPIRKQVQSDFQLMDGHYGPVGQALYGFVQDAYKLGMVNPNTGFLTSRMDAKS